MCFMNTCMLKLVCDYITSQDEYTSKMKEMAKSHTAETTEEFRKEIERKLTEQKKDLKVKKHSHN